jgi:glycerol-3-phosphate acyltransferase PlsY
LSKEILLLPLAYLLGSIPTGLLLARFFGGVDIRSTGSGNIGATNVYRTLGKTVGFCTLVGDCLKGLLPVVAARWCGLSDTLIALVGTAAFLGHIYTVFLGFKGGKGVATGLGVFLATIPLAVLPALAIFAAVLLKWRYVSLASIVSAASMPLIITLLHGNIAYITMAAVIATLIIIKHRENIQRLRDGSESKFRS